MCLCWGFCTKSVLGLGENWGLPKPWSFHQESSREHTSCDIEGTSTVGARKSASDLVLLCGGSREKRPDARRRGHGRSRKAAEGNRMSHAPWFGHSEGTPFFPS